MFISRGSGFNGPNGPYGNAYYQNYQQVQKNKQQDAINRSKAGVGATGITNGLYTYGAVTPSTGVVANKPRGFGWGIPAFMKSGSVIGGSVSAPLTATQQAAQQAAQQISQPQTSPVSTPQGTTTTQATGSAPDPDVGVSQSALTASTADIPPPTGWAALSGMTKFAIIGGAVAVIGGAYYYFQRSPSGGPKS